MFSTTPLLFVLLAASCASATEYGRTMADPGNGEIIPLDVALDPESMIVYPGTPDPPQECFKQSINLHDFNRRLVAIKVVDKRVCYVKPSSETYQEVAERLHHKGHQEPIHQVTEEWVIGKKLIKPQNVESMFGSLIANFCAGYNVYQMEDGHVIKEVARRAAKGNCYGCWGCRTSTSAQPEIN